MEIINFIFTSFWTFIGSVILITAAGAAVAGIVHALVPDKHIHINGYKLDDDQIQRIIKGSYEESND